MRSKEILDLLDKYKHPRNEQKLSEYFEQYKLKKLYNNFVKLKWRYESIVKDYYSTNDVEGNNNKVIELSENKKMTLSDCFDLFEEIFKSQRN